MAEHDDSTDDSQKTEAPSQRRLEDARKRGQVIYSREITNWLLFFTATVLVLTAGKGLFADMMDMVRKTLSGVHGMPTDAAGLGQATIGLVMRATLDLALPFFILMAVGILAGFIQTGPIFSFDPIMPSLSKISIMSGIKRMFSAKAMMELLKGIIKICVVTVALYVALSPYFDGVEHFVGLDVNQSLFDFETLFLKMMTAVLVVLFVLAAADYLYQRLSFMKNLRMSKQELKDEYKQTEGDPHVKGRLRQLREEKARQRMMQAVPKADVVITNPTHYAVALKYDSNQMNAPVLIAKGVDKVAQRIKEVAKENKVPIVENAPLARALHDSMELDDMIKPEHYKAVAEVISYVFKLKGRKLS